MTPMWIVLFLFSSGVASGYLLRNRKKILLGAEKCSNLAVYFLLFVLGIGMGRNPEIVQNLEGLTGKALALAVGPILMSILAAWSISRFFPRARER